MNRGNRLSGQNKKKRHLPHIVKGKAKAENKRENCVTKRQMENAGTRSRVK